MGGDSGHPKISNSKGFPPDAFHSIVEPESRHRFAGNGPRDGFDEFERVAAVFDSLGPPGLLGTRTGNWSPSLQLEGARDNGGSGTGDSSG